MSGANLSTSTIDVGGAYRELRFRVQGLVTGLGPDEWSRVVPHCPEWTIRQTLAHLVGIVDDGINNNMVGVTTPPWTKVHVDKRADKMGPEILEEWATYAPFVEARATNEGMRLSQLLFDAVTHEHDLRFALTQPGARNSDAVAVGLGFLVSRFEAREGGSPIHIIVDGKPVGTAAVTADKPTLSTTAFDVIRSFGSRRTASQILSLDWSDDPSELLDRLVPFGLPLTPISE